MSFITPVRKMNFDKIAADQNDSEQKTSNQSFETFRAKRLKLMNTAKQPAANLDEKINALKDARTAKDINDELAWSKEKHAQENAGDTSKLECISDTIKLTEEGAEVLKKASSKEDEKEDAPVKCNKEESAAEENISETSMIYQDYNEAMEESKEEDEYREDDYREGEENIEDDEDREYEDRDEDYEEDKEEDYGNSLDGNYHSDCLDIDNMTYEQLLALGDKVGNVNKGLSDAQIEVISVNT